jgi:hypothetical protein
MFLSICGFELALKCAHVPSGQSMLGGAGQLYEKRLNQLDGCNAHGR